MLPLYKLVIRDKNGKVIQSHEIYGSSSNIHTIVSDETAKGYSVTITRLR
jgi:hypothetical protein